MSDRGDDEQNVQNLASLFSEEEVRVTTTSISHEHPSVTIQRIKSETWKSNIEVIKFVVVAAVACIILLILSKFLIDIYPTSGDDGKNKIIVAATTMISAALGFLFGKVSK